MDKLPSILPLLPLQGNLLMPKTQLPFYISQSSHISMIADIIKTDFYVGVVQTQEGAGFFRFGTAGKLTSVHDIDEGRLLITIEGISRFEIIEEDIDPTQDYVKALVSYDQYEIDLATEADFPLDRTRLFEALRVYSKGMDISINIKELELVPNDKLITAITMLCPFDPSEKQAVLEASSMIRQSELLTTIIEMANVSNYQLTCH
jgi:Lon protease-like protein